MIKIKTLTKIEKTALEEFNSELLKKLGNNVVLIKLYGSKARGDFHKGSDIDILVVLKKEDKKARKIIYHLVTQLLLKYSIYLSVKIFSLTEYRYSSQLPTIFMDNVNREGIRL